MPSAFPLRLAAAKLPVSVTVPWNVGDTLSTTFPVPVLVVTPVPPLLTASVPYTFARLRDDNPVPLPETLATEITEGKRALAIVPVKLPAGIALIPSAFPLRLAAAKLPVMVTTPCSVGDTLSTTFPVPVLVVTPVPPLLTPKVPYTFAKFNEVSPAPLPATLLTDIAAGKRALLSVPMVMLLALPSNPEPDTMPVKKAPLPSM